MGSIGTSGTIPRNYISFPCWLPIVSQVLSETAKETKLSEETINGACYRKARTFRSGQLNLRLIDFAMLCWKLKRFRFCIPQCSPKLPLQNY